MTSKKTSMSDFVKMKRHELESDLFAFAKYINPTYIYGEIHEEIFRWMSGETDKNQLVLIPRGHLKSHCLAVWTAWWVTKHPWTTMVYVSATDKLAVQQLFAIKQMLTSERYRLLWPEMINEREGDREVWNKTEIMVDHPLRKENMVRDYTIHATSIKGNSQGLHCDVLLFDDIVVQKNAYTELGREEVSLGSSAFIAIKNADAVVKAVGTLHDKRDIYHQWMVGEEEIYDSETGEFTGTERVWQVLQYEVEDSPNRSGDGNFLWPRQMHPETGRWEGYDIQTLARKRAEYFSTGQHASYYSQYYNDTNASEADRVDKDNFQYYRRSNVEVAGGKCYYKVTENDTEGRPSVVRKELKVFAGMDVAWTERRGSDYTAIGVVGVDEDGYLYILDLDRFKTSQFDVYYDRVIQLHRKWGFRKIRIETNAGGKFVELELKNRIRISGDNLAVEGKHATRNEGTKQERHAAILEPRYANQSVFHFSGGLMPIFEEEVILERPPHDDLIDAVCGAIEIANPPAKRRKSWDYLQSHTNVITDSRFGGRRKR